MAELWVGSGGGVLLEPPERCSCRKHHLLGKTEDKKGGEGERRGETREVGVVNEKRHFLCFLKCFKIQSQIYYFAEKSIHNVTLLFLNILNLLISFVNGFMCKIQMDDYHRLSETKVESCFTKPTIHNPKIFNLQWYTTDKSRHFFYISEGRTSEYLVVLDDKWLWMSSMSEISTAH